ncbi:MULTISPECIES: hypothetical protein [unclassified Streptomyces]
MIFFVIDRAVSAVHEFLFAIPDQLGLPLPDPEHVLAYAVPFD